MAVSFENNASQILAELERKKAMALRAIGGFVEGEAKLRTPVDTGNLRNSITHQEEASTTTIGTPVEYSVFVHEGVTGRNAKPFLKDAITQNEKQMEDLTEKILKG